MRRLLTACAVALLALGTLNGCSQGNNSIQVATGATITNLAPSGVLLGGGDFVITVIASPFNGFKTNTVVQWNEQTLVSTPLNSITITAVVPAALIAKSGTAYINTFTPQSGTGQNGLSNSLAFLIYGSPNPGAFLERNCACKYPRHACRNAPTSSSPWRVRIFCRAPRMAHRR